MYGGFDTISHRIFFFFGTAFFDYANNAVAFIHSLTCVASASN